MSCKKNFDQSCSSYVNVEHDFEYKTNDGREISIKKDERLYLIQKTNSDWWKVVRNREQRSFYVPVTYVTELGSKQTAVGVSSSSSSLDNTPLAKQKNNDDNSLARRKHVEKWLSNTVEGSSPENLEDIARLETCEDVRLKEIRNRIEIQKQNLLGKESPRSSEIKSERKSLERFRNVVRKLSNSIYASDESSPGLNSTKNSDNGNALRTVMENADAKPSQAHQCPVYSPKRANELDRNLFDYQNQNHHSVSKVQRSGIRAGRSTDSIESSYDRRSVNSDSLSSKTDSRSRSFSEELSFSIQKNSAIKRHNVGLPAKPGIVEKRPTSPLSAGRGTPPSSVSASPQSNPAFDYSENAMKILNDKRKSWAVEELMSELTQIRREKVDSNTSNFVLRSVEIRDRFDPLEKLTQELHDLHTGQRENDFPLPLPSPDRIVSQDEKKANARSGESSKSFEKVEQQYGIDKSLKSPKNKSVSLLNNNDIDNEVEDNSGCSIVRTNFNPAKSSPKRQDEFEEANILNDESRVLPSSIEVREEGRSSRKTSLSADKEHYVSTYQKHLQPFKSDSGSCDNHFENFEEPSYSNISIKQDKTEGKHKERPQLKLKISNVDSKIKLTPSLEKLANQIQFLPATRTSVVSDNDAQQSPITKNRHSTGVDDRTNVTTKELPECGKREKKLSPNNSIDYSESSIGDDDDDDDDDDDRQDLINVRRDGEMWKNFKTRLNSRGSLKSNVNIEERTDPLVTKDSSSPRENCGEFIPLARKRKSTNLKKSATFNCVAVPEYYKHFQRHGNQADRSTARRIKRRSRSLDDVRHLLNLELRETLATLKKSGVIRNSLNNGKLDLEVPTRAVVKPIPKRRNILPIKDVPNKLEASDLSSFHKDAKISGIPVVPPTVSKSYENLNKDFTNVKVFDANKSTAVSFKNLLCTSDSGSDEYLHYKSFPKSPANRNEHSAYSSDSRINAKTVVSSDSLPVFDRSAWDEQILSCNISSEALFSQSESEVYALSELSNNSSPITVDRESRENTVNLPSGWKQEYDAHTKQFCFVNLRGEKGVVSSEMTQMNYKWLPSDLKNKVFGNFDYKHLKTMFSTFDWLREIRFQCPTDYYDFVDSNNDSLENQNYEWFSSNDEEGKIYFFEENSNESSWVLPSVSITEPTIDSLENMGDKEADIELRQSSGSDKFRLGKARSMVIGHQRANKKEQVAVRRSGSVSHDWPQLFNGNMCILKEGILQRTKITENGKRLRKNWSTSYVVLSELFLLFFKDAKAFSAMKSGQSAAAKPDISVDLNGATIEHGDKASSRKNVYVIGTILGLQVLIQCDNTAAATEWYKGINDVIKNLPSSLDAQPTVPSSPERGGVRREVKSKLFPPVNTIEENKIASKIGRSRSMKIKKFDGSTEDLNGASSAERQTKIKAKLKRFFQRRPTMDSLVKNGIYKDEPAFGSYLKDVCLRQPPMIPRFVKACIEILENNLENMKADGLYRASGNLSQIQKIRLQVDQNNFDILAQEEDVHVLTGSLKLFFRELKEPLIPYEFFERALKASMSKKKSERIQVFREIVRALSAPHYDTLQFLLQHLLKVTSYQEYNRMHIPNLAIVFGPTLMWPEIESANMALDLMQQNLVIECLLSEYDKIFK